MVKVNILVGLPRSGKSTWAKKQGLPIVNRDSIRLALHGKAFLPSRESEVTQLETLMVKSLLLAGHEEIIIDATHITKKRRNRWIKELTGLCDAIEFVVFDTSEEVCISRAKENDQGYLIPVITRMAIAYQEVEKHLSKSEKILYRLNPIHNFKG